MKNSPDSSDRSNTLEVFEQIERAIIGRVDPTEIKQAILDENPDFNIGDLSLDAEIYFQLAMASINHGPPNKEHFELDDPTGKEEFDAEQRIHEESQDTLRQVLKTLGESIDLSYFEIQPKGDDLEDFREFRLSGMQSALQNLGLIE